MELDPLDTVESLKARSTLAAARLRRLNATVAIGVALLAMMALTELWWLDRVSRLPTMGGVLMGLSGLAGWSLHPTALIQLLS